MLSKKVDDNIKKPLTSDFNISANHTHHHYNPHENEFKALLHEKNQRISIMCFRAKKFWLRAKSVSMHTQALPQSGLLHLLSHEVVPAVATLPYQPNLMT